MAVNITNLPPIVLPDEWLESPNVTHLKFRIIK